MTKFKQLQAKAGLSNTDLKQLLGGVSISTIKHWRNDILPVPAQVERVIKEYITFIS
jgi:hypothetical protein